MKVTSMCEMPVYNPAKKVLNALPCSFKFSRYFLVTE